MRFIGKTVVSFIVYIVGWLVVDVIYALNSWDALAVPQGLSVAIPVIGAALIVNGIWD